MPTGEEEPPKKTKSKKPAKPKIIAKRASVPKGKDPATVTLDEAIQYLALPRELGVNPSSQEKIMANTGRFGPYIAHNGEFRSLKKGDDPYTITLERAIEILSTPKPLPKGVERAFDIGKHPTTGKMLTAYKSKSGWFLKKGLRRISLPETADPEAMSPGEAAEYLK